MACHPAYAYVMTLSHTREPTGTRQTESMTNRLSGWSPLEKMRFRAEAPPEVRCLWQGVRSPLGMRRAQEPQVRQKMTGGANPQNSGRKYVPLGVTEDIAEEPLVGAFFSSTPGDAAAAPGQGLTLQTVIDVGGEASSQ